VLPAGHAMDAQVAVSLIPLRAGDSAGMHAALYVRSRVEWASHVWTHADARDRDEMIEMSRAGDSSVGARKGE
jgi:hypothetical protein